MGRRIFITGIGTDVGKTVVSAIVARALDAEYWKPVQAGDLDSTDSMRVAEWASCRVHGEAYRLMEPMSPHAAAAREGVALEWGNVKIPETEKTLVIEGAGGLLVPVNDHETMLDWIPRMQAEVVLVSKHYLGSINHTLMSAELLAARGIPVLGIVFNGDPNPETEQAILNRTRLKMLGRLLPEPKIDANVIEKYATEWRDAFCPLQSESIDFNHECGVPGAIGSLHSREGSKLDTDSNEIEDKTLVERDSETLWRPFTWKQAPDPLPVRSAQGAEILLEDGRTILDAISSWWVNPHGHNHPHITRKISEQLQRLHHVMFAGFTHEGAVELAERLLQKLPKNQGRIFFSDNGSTAVEIALKMAIQFFHNQGAPRTKIVTLKNGYHGDTFGSMSVGSREAFSKPFLPFLFDAVEVDWNDLEGLESILKSQEVAAFIFEPLIQGAGGMRFYPAEALDQMIALCQQYGTLTIADEVMTGFGRTGTFFATNRLVHSPDLVCMSKGLTGGTLAMGATSCTEAVRDAFVTDDRMQAFLHGHSFTANPIACAASLASLDLFDDPAFEENLRRIESRHKEFAEILKTHPRAENVRTLGTILAFDFVSGEASSYFNPVRDLLYAFFIDRGVLLRPLGNVVYVLPPFCMTDAQLQRVYDVILEALNEL